MFHNTKYGKIGENIARNYLVSQGYIILGENYRLGYDEIDIIASHKKCLIFIEVKTRLSSTLGSAEYHLSLRKVSNMKRFLNRFQAINNSSNKILKLEFIAINLNTTYKMANIKHYLNII